MKTAAEITKEYREARNLSMRKFALLVGVSAQAVSWWERGLMQPTPDRLYNIQPGHPAYDWAQAILEAK